MTSLTTNYSLTMYDPTTDAGENFIDYRTDMAGTSASSNVQKIDTAIGDNADDITTLQAKKNIIKVSGVFDSSTLYLGTVSGYASYSANDVIDLVLDTDSTGTVTLNINSLGIKSVMKTNSSGTAVNLDNTNLLADRHYLFSYDGTRWIWIGATSADQIDIGGTASNFVSIATDGSLEDSTTAASDFVTKALYDANTILSADTDDTPAVLTVAEQTLVGRITAGNIDALTVSEAQTLLNVEDGADVTDVTNVTAAGALMDSEVDVDIKTFALPASTTISTFGASIIDDATEADFKATTNLEIGVDVLAEQTIGIADNNLLEVDHASVADNDYAKFTANGLEGRSYSEVISDINSSLPAEIGVACSDEETDLSTGTASVTFRMPFAMTITDVRANVNTAPTDATITIDINEGGTTVLSTKLTIDATEKTSTTAATPAVISDSALADDAEITIDIDQVGSTIAGTGLKVWLIGTRA